MGTKQINEGKPIYEQRETSQNICRCNPTRETESVTNESNHKLNKGDNCKCKS